MREDFVEWCHTFAESQETLAEEVYDMAKKYQYHLGFDENNNPFFFNDYITHKPVSASEISAKVKDTNKFYNYMLLIEATGVGSEINLISKKECVEKLKERIPIVRLIGRTVGTQLKEDYEGLKSTKSIDIIAFADKMVDLIYQYNQAVRKSNKLANKDVSKELPLTNQTPKDIKLMMKEKSFPLIVEQTLKKYGLEVKDFSISRNNLNISVAKAQQKQITPNKNSK